MCQPQDKGGKRCLAHHPLTKFVKRVVGLKTGASEELINQAMKELYKEGKKQAPPTVEEVTKWLDMKRFATEIDPELSEHERKIQLNQIDKAAEESKKGVTGGAWYAWKNLKKRVSEKMKYAKKAAIAVGLTGALAFGLTACVGSDGVGNTPAPTPSPTSTSEPVEPATPPVSVTTGDAIATGQVVTDEFGPYQTIAINTADDSMQLNPAIVTPAVAEAGWTNDDVLSAQQWTAKFVTEQGLDSSAFDTSDGWNQWKTNEGANYINTNNIDLNKPSKTSDRSAIILNNPDYKTAVSVRDGQPRFNNTQVTINSVDTLNENGVNYLNVNGNLSSQQRISDEAMIDSYIKANAGATKEDVISQFPQFADGKGESLKWNFNYSYFLERIGDSWKIAGYNNTYQIDTSNLVPVSN